MNVKSRILILCCITVSMAAFGQRNSLDFYVDQALANSPLLKDYKYQVQSNLVDSQRIRAMYKPQVNGSSINSYAPVIHGYGYDNIITNGAIFTALVGVNKTFVSPENLDAQFQSIQLQNKSLDNTSRLTEQDIKRNVVAQYITAYGNLQQIQFNREINALLRKEEKILKQLTEKNVYRQTDYLAFLVTLQQQELLLKQLQIQFKSDVSTLNYLCGIRDTSAVTLLEPALHLAGPAEPYHSIFFQQFTLDSLKLANSRNLIGFNYRPKLNVYADGGYVSSFTYQPYKNFGASVGMSLLVPIYDGHQRKLQYNKLDVAEFIRMNYKDFFARQYDQQIAQLMQQLEGTEQLLEEINAQIKYSQSLITVNAKLLETGDARIPDYIIALNAFLNAKFLLTQNTINRLQIINQINYWNR